jgi:hypothetical protein
MTPRSARTQARSEISRVYKTAANGHTTTWGFSILLPGRDKRTQSDIGTYREAVSARLDWIDTRVGDLTETFDFAGADPSWATW